MKTKRHNLLLIFFMCIGGLFTFSQEKELQKADIDYYSYGYLNAREIYLKVADKGYSSPELFEKIANSYYFNAQYDQALDWFEKLFNMDGYSPTSSIFLRYAQSLRANGKEAEAKKYYKLFSRETGKSTYGHQLDVDDYLKLIERNSNRYDIVELEQVNSKGIDFGQAVYNDKLVYASTRDVIGGTKIESTWDGMSFLDLYEVKIYENKVTGKPKKLAGDINNKFHESSAVFTKDGETIYFTRSNSSPEDIAKKDKLKIYRAHLVNGKWTDIEDLPINNDTFSTAHPALNPLEDKLYFSSDRPGGLGLSDLYVVTIEQDGTLGVPENLGPEINTSGKETFPFVSGNNELYFSSDGHFGLGGLDIFYVNIKSSEYGNILNVGAPVNSYADDFAFGINHETKNGFFSSDRSTAQKKDNRRFIYSNIYALKEVKPIINQFESILEGTVTDKHTGQSLFGVSITVYNEKGEVYKVLKTDEYGVYKVHINCCHFYRVRADMTNYDSDEKMTESVQEQQTLNFSLNKNTIALIPGTDIASVLNIQHILFDFDKSKITNDAKVKLEKLLVIMQEYPKLKIAIQSHTDNRGTATYNMMLSNRRAEATKDYLISHGVEKDRLITKGFGETQPIIKCEDGTKCTSEQHHKNRRSEFIVIK